MITVWTQAYNTEKYMRQCIESVLNQTYTDFEYIIVDNGSTDGTGKIIDEYAAADTRIRVYRETDTYRGIRYDRLMDNIRGKYFAALDSDDWLEPDFLMNLYRICEQEDLDICVCGTNAYVEHTGKTLRLRIPDKSLVIQREEFPLYFPQIHRFLRTTWGKLIKAKTLKTADLSLFRSLIAMQSNGSDTAFSMSIFDNSMKVGMLDQILHNYRIRKSSVSQEYHVTRYDAYEKHYEQIVQLLSRFGTISPLNERFCRNTFFHAIRDVFEVCLASNLSIGKKVDEILHVLSKQRVMEARKEDISEDGISVLGKYLEKLIENRDKYPLTVDQFKILLTFIQPSMFENLNEKEYVFLLSHINIIEDIINKQYMSAFKKLAELSKINPLSRSEAAEKYCLLKLKENDNQHLQLYLDMANEYTLQQPDLLEKIREIIHSDVLFSSLAVDASILGISDVIYAVYIGEYDKAIDYASEKLQQPEFEIRLPLANFMKIVSAKHNDSAAFVYFYKVYTIELINSGLLTEAADAAQELHDMIPNDPDVIEIANYIGSLLEER